MLPRRELLPVFAVLSYTTLPSTTTAGPASHPRLDRPALSSSRPAVVIVALPSD